METALPVVPKKRNKLNKSVLYIRNRTIKVFNILQKRNKKYIRSLRDYETFSIKI